MAIQLIEVKKEKLKEIVGKIIGRSFKQIVEKTTDLIPRFKRKIQKYYWQITVAVCCIMGGGFFAYRWLKK